MRLALLGLGVLLGVLLGWELRTVLGAIGLARATFGDDAER